MKKKILSLLTAFAMVFGIIAAPFTSASAADEQGTQKVTLHKILQTKESLGNSKFPGREGLNGKKYVGESLGDQETDITGYFGEGSKQIEGVYFVWTTKDDKVIDKSTGKAIEPAITITKGKLPEGTTALPETALAGKTTPTGIEFDTSKLPAGDYKIHEIPALSTYIGKQTVGDKEVQTTLTASKAVPVDITLPLANSEGTIAHAHVYPKNTEDYPTTNKDFSEQFTDNQQGRDLGVQEESQTSNPTDKTKDQQSHYVGEKINYTVRTTIPADAKYASSYWDDKMTEGLTYNNDLVIKLGEETLARDTDYTVEQTTIDGKVVGFKAQLTPAGLERINGKNAEQVLLLTYSATLNKDAVEEIPESNDVTFHFGNHPNKGNTPIPTKPNEQGELEVSKTWDDKVWAEGEKATFRLVDAQTGKTVTVDDLVEPTEESKKAAFNTYKEKFNAEVEIGYKENGGTAKWEYLNPEKQYKAIEINMTAGTESEYKEGADGKIVVVNHKTNNPSPINPTEPKVVTHAKRFVKRDENSNKRLEGARFVVSTTDNKFLKAKETTNDEAITKLKTTLQEKVDAYNKLGATASEEDKKAAKKAVDDAQIALNNAIYATEFEYELVDNQKDATVFTSNSDGQVEVKGLKKGTYTLIEIGAPSGYALPSNAKWDFTVGSVDPAKGVDNDYYTVEQEKAETKTENALRINNTLVSIPQTGGIGSLIFIVAGLAIMGGAFVAYKKSQAVEA